MRLSGGMLMKTTITLILAGLLAAGCSGAPAGVNEAIGRAAGEMTIGMVEGAMAEGEDRGWIRSDDASDPYRVWAAKPMALVWLSDEDRQFLLREGGMGEVMMHLRSQFGTSACPSIWKMSSDIYQGKTVWSIRCYGRRVYVSKEAIRCANEVSMGQEYLCYKHALQPVDWGY